MPPGIPYIIGNEAAERFSYYGMSAILAVFMTTYLRDASGRLATMSENDANTWFHTFGMANYFFPVFGAILSDAFWGKFRTIFWLSLVYCAGHAALAINDTRLGLALGLGLIAVGAGGIKPCVASNVGDQFGHSNAHLVSRAFSWFYLSINAGSTVSILLIPALLDRYGPHVAFAVPGVFMLIATIVIWLGRYRFVHVPPKRGPFLRMLFSRQGALTLVRLAVIFAFVAVFWSLWTQSQSEWVLQAKHLNLHFAGITWLPAQIGVVNAVMILVLIPAFQYVIYPLVDRVFPLTPLRKIGLGLLVVAAAFLISAWIETQLAAGRTPNIACQLPAYLLLSAAEVMVSITALEFAYTQAPKLMKSVIMAYYLLAISAGNAITAVVHLLIRNPDGSAKLSGTQYYLLFAGFAAAASLIFVPVALRYREQTHLQDELAPNPAPSNSAAA